ncbi:DUF2478 domain-containing protein [Marimonas sp. MJW-29]|uniref:DUF2478 domain-containing protein n=1 Tax=Sulfitobacter sediminis TaxID=3234186 RepID=A0ABV3RT93_9RHOB
MNIAYTMAPGRGDTDLLLYRFAQSLLARGLRPCGTVQINTERADAGPCDMDVMVLPKGPVFRISQALGSASRGCRLDPGALEEAVGAVSASLHRDIDCLIVNKFGKHKAEGRGFRPVIALALELDIPVLVGINALNRAAFLEFTGGIASEVSPDCKALCDWFLNAKGAGQTAAKTLLPASGGADLLASDVASWAVM